MKKKQKVLQSYGIQNPLPFDPKEQVPINNTPIKTLDKFCKHNNLFIYRDRAKNITFHNEKRLIK